MGQAVHHKHSNGEAAVDIENVLIRVLRIAGAAAGLTAASLLLYASVPALGATFTYTNPSCTSFQISGTPPTQTVTCVTSGGGGGGGSVPVCAPSANPAAPPLGSSTTITANCSNAPTAYVWGGTGCLSSTTGTCTVTNSSTRNKKITFTVQATNASGPGAQASIAVTWQ
jgi:hypothetical protein